MIPRRVEQARRAERLRGRGWVSRAAMSASSSSRRRSWLTSYQESVARLISLGLAWLASGDDAGANRGAHEDRGDACRQAGSVDAIDAGGGLDLRAPGRARRPRSPSASAGSSRRDARVEQLAGTLDRLDRPAEPVAERDLAAVEPAERDAQSQAIGQEEEVVGGVVVHGAAFLRKVRTPWAGPMT